MSQYRASRSPLLDAQAAKVNHARNWLQIAVAAAIALPGPVLHTLELAGVIDLGLPSLVESAIFGIAILAAATLLVWASEVAEQLISATLALAILAIVAVLPEYAVDLYFAWTAPDSPAHAGFALANMTGANRLLVGFAWPVVFFIFWFKQRKSDLVIGNQNAVGLIFLGVATIYNFSLPIRQNLSLIDSGVLIALFLGYLVLASRAPPREAELVGPSVSIAALPLRLRWSVVVGIFLFAAGTVFASAEPFANGLVDSGKALHIDEFLLVQWVAPIASEAPEFLLAAMLAFRGRAQAGLTLLVASEVNQWTLLVGSLPLAYSISGHSLSPLPMDDRQVAEVFLTGSLALFAVAVLMSLSFSRGEALLMFLLFAAQFFVPYTWARFAFGVVYMLLAFAWFIRERANIPQIFRTARIELAGGSDTG